MIEVPRSPIRGVALTEQWSCGSLRKVEWPCKLSISYERDNLPFLWWPVVVRSLRGSVARGVHCACMSLQKVGVNQDIKNHSSWGTTRTKSLTVIVSRTQESAGILTQVMVEPIREGEQSRPLPYLFRARGRRLLHWCSRGHPRRRIRHPGCCDLRHQPHPQNGTTFLCSDTCSVLCCSGRLPQLQDFC